MGQIRHPNATPRRDERRRQAREQNAAADAAKLEHVRGILRAVARQVKAGHFEQGSRAWEEAVAPAFNYKDRHAKAIARAEARERDLKKAGSVVDSEGHVAET